MDRRDRAEPPPATVTEYRPRRDSRRGLLVVLAIAYLGFVIYGSLVPLDFRSMPLAEALERFRAIRYLELGIGSRADWVANLLLFVPLTFFWAAVVWPRRRANWRLPVGVALLLGAFMLAMGIEFTQLYFPPRTVSINDIAAETLGAVIGLGAWWLLGGRVERWLQTLPLVKGPLGIAQRLLTGYLVLLFAYNLLPLDLTISPVELYHKWREGKVVLVPFTAPFVSRAQQVYDLLSDIAVWIPVALLWRLARRATALQAWTAAFSAALILELLQLFVYSRVTDTTDLVTAAIGATLGARLASHWLPSTRLPPASAGAPATHSRALPWVLAVVAWLGVLALVFWYPFDFNLDRDFLRSRLQGLRRVPFEAYYFGTEFRAITEVLHKTLFMAPLGFLLNFAGQRLLPSSPRWLMVALPLAFVAGCAGTIEAVQLLLPRKNADFTDAALAWLGGAFGVLLARTWGSPRGNNPAVVRPDLHGLSGP